jgi:hypothetical protein
MSSKTYDHDGKERFTVEAPELDPDYPDDHGFYVITKTERNIRGRFVFSESVCIPADVWKLIVCDSKIPR